MSTANPHAPEDPDAAAPVPWHTMGAAAVADELSVTVERGLDSVETERRLDEHGPNALAEGAATPLWRRVVALLTEPMTIVLILAAVVSAVVSRELETPIVILVVVVFNAVLNLVQEQRAENSLQALQDMTVTRARVRRDGRVVEVDAQHLVPGDVVLLEAGDVVPADGRLVETAGMEVQEAALTGESAPVAKHASAVDEPDASLGDRDGMGFMSTSVTRGRGVLVVTETGMRTEIGRVAGMLGQAGQDTTPLQRQIAKLATLLSVVAGVVVAVVFVLGLLRGQAVEELLLTAVSLAVATIPEGLTAVVAFTLAMGAARLARRGAIIKTLSSVETLGSTAHIATDKTGTLTLNEMTARELFAEQHRFEVTGEGYSTDGEIRPTGDGPAPDVRGALLAMALASDAVVDDGEMVGDPTEGALVVLAAKGGLDVDAARRDWPRAAEVPFDSDRKYMATFHRWDGAADAALTQTWARGPVPEDDAGARVFVKGGPDVVLGRCTRLDTPDGAIPLDDSQRERLAELNADIGSHGLRVMAVAQRDLGAGELDLEAATEATPEELDRYVEDLTLLALVGIVDPPRPEVRDAVAQAHEAGIAVHMITGDHVGTASAIAEDLGIRGEAVSGADLDDLDDDALADRAARLGVLARVSPEHKIRMVDALRSDGSVVAMTGDGVNDAPALKQADIGIAMGITGTEVSKGAARMILTDDNFATIVAAVREGRGIYDNVVKFVRFQIATAWGFVLIFLTTGLLGAAGGVPFTALQVLWVNIIMDGPPAMALGLDRPDPDVMRRPPRPVGEPILTRSRLGRIVLSAAVMAAGTLGVLAWAESATLGTGQARTLAFTTFVLFQVFNLLNVRSREESAFSRRTFTNRTLWISVAVILVLQVAVVYAPFLQGLFSTTAIPAAHWGLAVAVASAVLWAEEIRKAVSRRAHRG
ncbi:cation-translocating P-type ATPase [Georgenia yuyongxinii]